jgi:GST-like protein
MPRCASRPNATLFAADVVKVSIMIEEIDVPYEWHRVDFGKGDQHTPEFLSLNPCGKIPALIDPAGA